MILIGAYAVAVTLLAILFMLAWCWQRSHNMTLIMRIRELETEYLKHYRIRCPKCGRYLKKGMRFNYCDHCKRVV